MTLIFALLMIIGGASLGEATVYHLDSTACSGDYSISSRDCTGTDGTSFTTIATARGSLSAGDTLCVRSGTYTDLVYLGAGKVGSASGGYISIEGCYGERPTFAVGAATGYALLISANNYTAYRHFILDGTGHTTHLGFRMESAHHIIVEDLEITQFNYNGVFIQNVTDVVIDSVHAHHQLSSTCVTPTRWYGLYARSSTRLTIRNSEFNNNPGGGMQIYPGPHTDLQIHNNSFHHNNFCEGSPWGGMHVAADSSGGTINGVKIYNNIAYRNGLTGARGGPGISVVSTAAFQVTNVEVHNNTSWGNRAQGGNGYGIRVGTNVISPSVKNNLVFGNESAQISNGATGATITHNACGGADSCGTTGKVTIAAVTECVVSVTDPDVPNLRLKQGTNACRGVGTSVSTRPAPVGVTDIGAFEQGSIVSAVVAGSHIEATVNAMSGIQPGAGMTGLSLECVTCTGTPVLLANPKPGSTNTIQISVSGLTGSGTARLNLASTNITDSGYVGLPSAGLAQFLNSLSALDITGTVDNTSGDPTPPAGGLYSEFLLDEGAGTTATDKGGVNNGTVSTGVTWVNDTSGTGVYIPTAEEAGDSTYRHVASTYGQGVNPTSESASVCVLVLPDLQYSQKVIVSTGNYSSNRRAYAGIATVNGVKQWGQGVQTSNFTSGVTEFPVQAQLTLVCQRFNSAVPGSGTGTSNLSVNRTIGTSAAANKTYTSYTFADDFRAGSDGTYSVNTGGVRVYAMWVWNNTYISDAEVQALYDSLFPAGGSVGGYAEVTHRWQAVYLDGSLNPINFKSVGSQEIEVVAGGAVAIEFQVDCTGGACDPLAVRLHAADIAGNTGAVPQELDAFGLAMWRDSTSNILNRGVSTCCLSGALTAVDGITILDSVASNTIELNEDSSTMFRFIVRVATDQVGELYTLYLKQDNGAELDGVAGTLPQIRVVAPRASGGF